MEQIRLYSETGVKLAAIPTGNVMTSNAMAVLLRRITAAITGERAQDVLFFCGDIPIDHALGRSWDSLLRDADAIGLTVRNIVVKLTDGKLLSGLAELQIGLWAWRRLTRCSLRGAVTRRKQSRDPPQYVRYDYSKLSVNTHECSRRTSSEAHVSTATRHASCRK